MTLWKSTLLDLTERNANHIIPSCCHVPVSCRSLVHRCGSPGSYKPQIYVPTFLSRVLQTRPTRCVAGSNPDGGGIFGKWMESMPSRGIWLDMICSQNSCVKSQIGWRTRHASQMSLNNWLRRLTPLWKWSLYTPGIQSVYKCMFCSYSCCFHVLVNTNGRPVVEIRP